MNCTKHNGLLMILTSLAVALLLVGCNRKTVYSSYLHTPIDSWGWESTDTMFFSIPSVTEGGLYSEEVGLRCNSSYPFKELYLIVMQESFPHYTYRCDTVRFAITDENGVFLGKGISYFQYTAEIGEISLQKGDSLQVSIRHCMRRENLKGLADVGFSLIRLPSKGR